MTLLDGSLETYFEVQGTTEEVKVRLAKVCMEGGTIHWFNLLRETEDELTWSKLKKALIERYGGRKSDNPFEELKDLQQNGDVEDYITDFEYVSSQVCRLPEDQYLGYFVGGLKPEIRLKVRPLNPRSRTQAMKMAGDIETELRGTLVHRSGGSMRQGKGFKEAEHGSGAKGEFGSNFGSSGRSTFGLGFNLGYNKVNNGSGPANNNSQSKSAQIYRVQLQFSLGGESNKRYTQSWR